MSVTEHVKAESLRLRKEKSSLAPFVSFILSEIQKIGKNQGNRETTEDEAIQVIKKLRATALDNIATATGEAGARAAAEVSLLDTLTPALASEDQIREALARAGASKKGNAMKAIRSEFGSRVDMKFAGQIFDQITSEPQ